MGHRVVPRMMQDVSVTEYHLPRAGRGYQQCLEHWYLSVALEHLASIGHSNS